MADNTCIRELNAQLQVLQGRVKSLEEQAASLQEVQITNIAQTCAGFAALIPTGGVAGLPTYIANQVILTIAAAALGEAASTLQGLGSGMGDYTADIAGMADTIKEIVTALISGKILQWEELQFELMLPLINVYPYLTAMVNNVMASAEEALDAAEAALALDPLNTELQVAYQLALNLRDSVINASASQNNLSECKIASKVLGL